VAEQSLTEEEQRVERGLPFNPVLKVGRCDQRESEFEIAFIEYVHPEMRIFVQDQGMRKKYPQTDT